MARFGSLDPQSSQWVCLTERMTPPPNSLNYLLTTLTLAIREVLFILTGFCRTFPPPPSHIFDILREREHTVPQFLTASLFVFCGSLFGQVRADALRLISSVAAGSYDQVAAVASTDDLIPRYRS